MVHMASKHTRHDPIELEQALEAVSQMFAQVKAEPTPAEAMLWADEIERLGPGVVMQFAHFWMAGGGQNGFLRAPRIVDVRRFCDPMWSDEAMALARLQTLVERLGPYRAPGDADGMDATLAHAVKLLGGWVRVCELMPDASDEHGLRAFEKRFASAWSQAQAAALQQRLDSAPLLPLGAQQSVEVLAAQRLPERNVPPSDAWLAQNDGSASQRM